MSEQSSIRCIQLPLVDWQLLLPNAAVAEIISYTKPQKAGEGWFDGMLLWRGASVPVISLEGLCQRNQVESTPRCRIAIIYNLAGDAEMPYLGLILQDIPRAYLAEEEHMQTLTSQPDCEFLYGGADMMQKELMIPDLDAIIDKVKTRIKS